MYSDLFFWFFISGVIWSGINFQFQMISWMVDMSWSCVEPSSFGWVGIIFLMMLFMECEDHIFWPIPVIYFYVFLFHHPEVEVFAWLTENWFNFSMGVLVYVMVGLCWAAIKLRLFFAKKENIEFRCSRKANEKVSDWRDRVWKVCNVTTKLRNWSIWWPLSVLHSLAYDLLADLWNMIFNNFLKKFYQKILDNALATMITDEDHADGGSSSDSEDEGVHSHSRSRSPNRKKNN